MAFAEYTHEQARILHLAKEGMRRLANSVELAEAVSGYLRFKDPMVDATLEDRRLSALRVRAQFAEGEAERGYPVLHAHGLVALWGALESLVFNLVVAWLRDDPGLLTDERLASVKVSLSEFTRLDEDDRLTYLVSEVSRRLKVEHQAGVTRFETLLDSVGMSGPVSEEVRKTLFEMFHIRNVLVHRAGIADRRFAVQCPWRTERTGGKLLIGADDFTRYLSAVSSYVSELVIRDMVLYGMSREEAIARIAKSQAEANEGDE